MMDRKIKMALKVIKIIFTNSTQNKCACENPEITHRTPGFHKTQFEYHQTTMTHLFICKNVKSCFTCGMHLHNNSDDNTVSLYNFVDKMYCSFTTVQYISVFETD